MCLVVDTNCFAQFFDKKHDDHHKFSVVSHWATKGRGSIIYGGRKYKKELKAASKYLKIFVELRKQGRIIELVDGQVDEAAKEISKIVNKSDFNDEHLVAIVSLSGCRVVVTHDRKAEKYLKDSSLYPKGIKRPRIYKNGNHKGLCCNENIVGKCLQRLA